MNIMDTKPSEVLRDIIAISEAMLVMACENDWERVALLEAERKVMVQRCLGQPPREQDAAEVAVAIRKILRLNQEVASLAGRCKDQLGADIHTQNVGRTASAAYLSHAG